MQRRRTYDIIRKGKLERSLEIGDEGDLSVLRRPSGGMAYGMQMIQGRYNPAAAGGEGGG